MAATNVFFVKPQNAKKVKNILEDQQLLDKRFRMTPHDGSSKDRTSSDPLDSRNEKLIAIPVTESCLDWYCRWKNPNEMPSSSSEENVSMGTEDVMQWIQSTGVYSCPFSTSMLGNHNKTINANASRNCESTVNCIEEGSKSDGLVRKLNTVQRALLESILSYRQTKNPFKATVSSILSLPHKTCPRKLEQLGDDHTLVIPPQAFLSTDPSFHSFLIDFIFTIPTTEKIMEKTSSDDDQINSFMETLWKMLAHYHNRNCNRVVRRGEISPSSKVRQSGHKILWISPKFNENASKKKKCVDNNEDRIASSPGWIAITEQGIKQSFDLTKVMFSRGNITEKIRFGTTLVQKGDVILDMYAGIGYYTLPALLASRKIPDKASNRMISSKKHLRKTQGRASFVYACEWNKHAFEYLQYNLQENGVPDYQYQLLEGDCRKSLKGMQLSQTGLFSENQLEFGVDRISLGLLPSSEGGWEMAVQCLRKNIGGWLHIHGNVAVSERWNWSLWICYCLSKLVCKFRDENNWHVICNHVERVKSFAPKVDHLVADVFIGPMNQFMNNSNNLLDTEKNRLSGILEGNNEALLLDIKGVAHICPEHIDPPSCALSIKGVLNQDWMR